MATIYTQQDRNVFKTWFLMACFLVVIIGLGYFTGYIYHNPLILYFAIIFSVLMNIMSYWYSDKIALSMSRAVEINPSSNSDDMELKRLVENLSITAGLPLPRIYIVEDLAPNAFATGRDRNHASIAVTRGLLNMMDKTELEGVLAHELSHIGNRDILLSTVVVVLVGFVSILSDMAIRGSFFGRRNSDEDKVGGILAIVGIIFIILSPIIATLIQLAISRKREFLADASGALLTRYPEGLASALKKIEAYSNDGGAPLVHASNATAHLFIANPFGASAGRGIAKLFMTHPPVEERVAALKGMDI